ncbi:MAG: cell division protein FtsZ [Pseudomonadota bacterium]
MINVRIQTPEVQKLSPKITVVGVGGAGGNAVNNMISSALEGCEFLVCNTDAQALEGSLSDNKIQLGAHVTGGLGAGAKPEIGRSAADESLDEVMQYLEGSNMAFITAGMGGGTGTGAAPIIAKACRDAGILTVGVVTKPFHFEGTHRMTQAEAGIDEMQDFVDTLIVIPNQNLFRVANEKTTFAEAFKMADGVLQSGVRGVTDLMVMPGLINLDFADIRSAMLEMGKAMMGNGEATGERRAVEAAEAAINNPLLDDVSMKGARGVIINVTGGHDMTLYEVDEACNRIRDEVDPNANIIFGSTFDEKMDGEMRVSVVATGIEAASAANTRGGTSGVRVTTINKPAAEKPAEPKKTATMTTSAGYKPQTEVAREMTMKAREEASSPAQQTEASEADMFEQREFTAQKQAATTTGSNRGTVHAGHFIPPSPVVPQKQDTAAYAATASTPVAAAPEPVQEVAQQPEVQEPVYAQQAAPQATMATPSSQSGLVLRPPVPGANAHERKKAPSLFERITSGVSQGVARFSEQGEEEQGGATGGSGSFHGGLQAQRSQTPQSPSQGQLNIDSPAAPVAKNEDDLDIPAFLRRQAN